MKVFRFLLMVGLAASVSEVNAQFRFPQLPSPPRILFGGFRPFFARPRPRPRPPRPPFLIPANQFFQQQQQNRFPLASLSRPRPPSRPRPFDFGRPPRPLPQRPPPPPPRRPPPPSPSTLAPPPPPLPPPRPPPPPQSISISQPVTVGRPPPAPPQPFVPSSPAIAPPNFLQTNDLSFRPTQTSAPGRPAVDASGFGSPRPESIINVNQFPQQQQQQQTRPPPPPPPPLPTQPAPPPPPRPTPPPPRPPPPQQTFPSPQQFTPTQPSFPPPLVSPNSNNIIGMTPPPPPSPTPQNIIIQTSTLGPLVPVTARPNQPLSVPSSNALDELLVNPVPSVNAGILPLANERPNEQQRFPPFT